MKGSVQALIETANKKSVVARKKVFANKASDQQHHSNLLTRVKEVMDIYHDVPSLRDNNLFRASMRELETAMTLSERKLKR